MALFEPPIFTSMKVRSMRKSGMSSSPSTSYVQKKLESNTPMLLGDKLKSWIRSGLP